MNGREKGLQNRLSSRVQRLGDIVVKPEVTKGCCVPKGWGEIIIENNEMYCKGLVFNEGCKFSMYYHMNKDETWYVEGEFIYRWIDTERAQIYEDQLSEGDG